MFPNVDNKTVVPITKRTEIILSIQVCRLSWMDFDYTENGGKKAFLANPTHQYHVSQRGEHDCLANSKKKGDYYEYPSFSHLTDELWL